MALTLRQAHAIPDNYMLNGVNQTGYGASVPPGRWGFIIGARVCNMSDIPGPSETPGGDPEMATCACSVC